MSQGEKIELVGPDEMQEARQLTDRIVEELDLTLVNGFQVKF